MTRVSICSYRAFFYFTVILLLAAQHPAGAKDQKMKPEELVAKHLESIGTPEARAAIRTRIAVGKGQILFIQPSPGNIVARSQVVSEGKMMRISMLFDGYPNYPTEQFAFDGNRANTSQIRPGVRVNLASFAYTYDVMLKEGLFGGSMTTAWALLDVVGRQPKLEYTGLKKIDGKQVHELRYRAKKGAGELVVWLRFDPETFRHVMSEYRLTQPPNMASSPTESSSMRDTIYSIKETFDEFRTVDGVTFPSAWKVKYSREGMGTTLLCEYNMLLTEVSHNKTLEAKAFALIEQ